MNSRNRRCFKRAEEIYGLYEARASATRRLKSC